MHSETHTQKHALTQAQKHTNNTDTQTETRTYARAHTFILLPAVVGRPFFSALRFSGKRALKKALWEDKDEQSKWLSSSIQHHLLAVQNKNAVNDSTSQRPSTNVNHLHFKSAQGHRCRWLNWEITCSHRKWNPKMRWLSPHQGTNDKRLTRNAFCKKDNAAVPTTWTSEWIPHA